MIQKNLRDRWSPKTIFSLTSSRLFLALASVLAQGCSSSLQDSNSSLVQDATPTNPREQICTAKLTHLSSEKNPDGTVGKIRLDLRTIEKNTGQQGDLLLMVFKVTPDILAQLPQPGPPTGCEAFFAILGDMPYKYGIEGKLTCPQTNLLTECKLDGPTTPLPSLNNGGSQGGGQTGGQQPGGYDQGAPGISPYDPAGGQQPGGYGPGQPGVPPGSPGHDGPSPVNRY